MALSPERQNARMSEIKNGGLDQYGAELFEQQQFEPAGIEGVKGSVFATTVKKLASKTDKNRSIQRCTETPKLFQLML